MSGHGHGHDHGHVYDHPSLADWASDFALGYPSCEAPRGFATLAAGLRVDHVPRLRQRFLLGIPPHAIG